MDRTNELHLKPVSVTTTYQFFVEVPGASFSAFFVAKDPVEAWGKLVATCNLSKATSISMQEEPEYEPLRKE
jgi:hypothetical protein